MKLYSNVDRIYNELRALGKDDGAQLSVDDLTPFDQYHYHGTDAVDEAARQLGLGPNSRVVEVGSGIGGPARYLAGSAGCHVTAVELQPDLNATAVELTGRCGLSRNVQHVCGDFLDGITGDGQFDAVVSWLALYHIADREMLFTRCRSALRNSGGFYAEDLFKRGEFSASEQADVSSKLYGNSLLSLNEYETMLRDTGFADIRVDDMTDGWTQFCAHRIAVFREQRSRHIQVHGEDIVNGLDDFYGTVNALFQGGNLGGVRVVAIAR